MHVEDFCAHFSLLLSIRGVFAVINITFGKIRSFEDVGCNWNLSHS